jgi:hypothetical protein
MRMKCDKFLMKNHPFKTMNVTKECFMEPFTSPPKNKRLITLIQELKHERNFLTSYNWSKERIIQFLFKLKHHALNIISHIPNFISHKDKSPQGIHISHLQTTSWVTFDNILFSRTLITKVNTHRNAQVNVVKRA